MKTDATRIFSPADRKRIEEAVDKAERNTSAEIVCAVTTESGRYDRAESIVGLAFALIALALAHSIHGALATGAGDWAGSDLHLGWQALAVVIGFVAGNILANRIAPLRRLVVGEKEIEAEVRRAAALAFAIGAVGNTAGRTGLLIYVSLFEHKVLILPDEQVREALGDEEIAQLRDLAVDDLKKRDFTAAFVDTLERAAPGLAAKLPADRQLNPNELPNHVLTFHPRPGSG